MCIQWLACLCCFSLASLNYIRYFFQHPEVAIAAFSPFIPSNSFFCCNNSKMGEFLTPLLQLTIAKLPGDEDKHLHMYEKSQLYQCCVEKLKFRGKPTAADTVQRLWTGVLTVFGLQHREKGLWEGKMCSESSHASQGEGEMREGWKGMFWSRIKGGERNREGSESSPRDSWETDCPDGFQVGGRVLASGCSTVSRQLHCYILGHTSLCIPARWQEGESWDASIQMEISSFTVLWVGNIH